VTQVHKRNAANQNGCLGIKEKKMASSSVEKKRMRCQLRVARPVSDLDIAQKMYCDGLGLEVLGQFRDHAGFDGVMLGSESMSYHFEFTHCRHHQIAPSPTVEDLIIFYEPDKVSWSERCEKLLSTGFVQVDSFNPYWDVLGKTFQDADGYRIVIQNDEWAT
jgi:catechol 2,3-dioxygenase-like lactoylglutathione lyase family enzyme